MDRYWAFKNAWSMDGLPGMQRGVKTAVTDSVKPIKKMVGQYAPTKGPRTGTRIFQTWHLILVALISSLGTTLLLLFMLARLGPGTVCFGTECADGQWERGKTRFTTVNTTGDNVGFTGFFKSIKGSGI